MTNVVSGRKMRVQKYNLPDTVVWNPWEAKAKEIEDFGDDEVRKKGGLKSPFFF